MNKFSTLSAAVLAMALTGTALAHGPGAKRGGIVQESGKYRFELVVKNGGATVYVEDHDDGRSIPTAGLKGKLTVLNGTQKTDVVLTPAADQTLVAGADAKLGSGSKAIAAIEFPDKTMTTVRFSVK